MFDLSFLILSIVLAVSVCANIILVMYFRKVVQQVYNAAEEASSIFIRLETFQEHLTSVYEMPTFYGDDTLSSLLQHVKDLTEFLVKYDEVYSFTQPDLLEQLREATMESEEPNEAEA